MNRLKLEKKTKLWRNKRNVILRRNSISIWSPRKKSLRISNWKKLKTGRPYSKTTTMLKKNPKSSRKKPKKNPRKRNPKRNPRKLLPERIPTLVSVPILPNISSNKTIAWTIYVLPLSVSWVTSTRAKPPCWIVSVTLTSKKVKPEVSRNKSVLLSSPVNASSPR